MNQVPFLRLWYDSTWDWTSVSGPLVNILIGWFRLLFPLLSHWQGYLMFYSLLATISCHFDLQLAPLLPAVSNCKRILSSHRCEGRSSSNFPSFVYHSTTAWVYLLPVKFAVGLGQDELFFPYFAITFFTPLRYRITPFTMCSRNNAKNITE